MISNGIMGQVAAQLAQMPDNMLVEMAKSPPVDMPGAQYMALSILGERAKQKMNPAPQGPPPPVLDQIGMQSGAPGAMGPGNPIASGEQALMAQQPVTQAQAQQMMSQARPMATGSQVPIGYEDYYELLRGGIGAMSPEEAMAQAQQFSGPDIIAPWADKIASERAQLGKDRKFDRWMALANAGAGISGANSGSLVGDLAAGLKVGVGDVSKAQQNHRAGMRDIDQRLFGLDVAKQARADKQGVLASGIFADAGKADRDARSSALGVATEDRRTDKRIAADAANTKAQINAANYRASLDNSLLNLTNRYIEMGYSKEAALSKAQEYFQTIAGRSGADMDGEFAGMTNTQLNNLERSLENDIAKLQTDFQADPAIIGDKQSKLARLRAARAAGKDPIAALATEVPGAGGGVATGATAASEGKAKPGARPILIPRDQEQAIKKRLYDGSGRYIGTGEDGIEVYKDPAG